MRAYLVMDIVRMKFIRKGYRSPDRFSSFHPCLLGGVTPLDLWYERRTQLLNHDVIGTEFRTFTASTYHKSPNVSMKQSSVVRAIGAEGKEIKGCPRCCVAEDLQF